MYRAYLASNSPKTLEKKPAHMYGQRHSTVYICSAILALTAVEIRAAQSPKCIV
jgi:hypothetical protein